MILIVEILIFSLNFSNSANVITNDLHLATSGPLEGKYLFFRYRYIVWDYLKKCSSVLGYSYISVKDLEIVICDKLSPAALINPTGTYEALIKDKHCTVCKGTSVGV